MRHPTAPWLSPELLAALPATLISLGLALGLGAGLGAGLGGCAGDGGLAPVETRGDYAPAPAGFWRVRRGDTLTAISRRTGQSVDRLVAWNRLEPPYNIYAGGLVRIEPPSGRIAGAGSKSARGAAMAENKSGKTAAAKTTSSRAAASGSIRWQWPLTGRIVAGYEAGDRTRQGIRIAASPGARVKAAADGQVVYSGSGLKGYGNLIIVKHDDRFLSVYGFNRRLIAKQDENVKAGAVLAEAGQGPNGDYLLHFEIRHDGSTVDPLAYLPGR